MIAGVWVSQAAELFNGHPVVLDREGKILPWYRPAERAYDHFLRLRWEFVKTHVPLSPGPAPRSSYPQYYFYCAYWDKNGRLEPDTWMNDIGEKIPNWFESARHYYAYTGDASVMKIVKDLIDYSMQHGTSPSSFAWPHFPYTATNAGDLDFKGFTSAKRFVAHEVQVDHAADIGLTYYRLYLFTKDKKYLNAAVSVADLLAKHARTGTSTQSVWPYRIVMDTGKVTSEYGANWFPAYELLRSLIRENAGDVNRYEDACSKVKAFILGYPMKTGRWTDGHSDTNVNSNTYKSNMSASNAVLYLLDHPEFDPQWREDVPRLIRWTEDNFVFRTGPGEPATQWGANIVGEQDDFLFKMDYQTARYAAECAHWYAVSGDAAYKEKAYRALNWVTYASNNSGQCLESPVSKKPISNWWSDCYGECPRMFYHAFAAIPEWAPPRENHILYSTGIVLEVHYEPRAVEYSVAGGTGADYLRLSFRPETAAVDNVAVPSSTNCSTTCYTARPLAGGDYGVRIQRPRSGRVSVH
ncbi:MAG TPA: hypothetical protein VH601_20385 [Bryobacteraceae bacterium]|jgi:hypothetical protein